MTVTINISVARLFLAVFSCVVKGSFRKLSLSEPCNGDPDRLLIGYLFHYIDFFLRRPYIQNV